jgi:mono/diheme cytochrome c family protein
MNARKQMIHSSSSTRIKRRWSDSVTICRRWFLVLAAAFLGTAAQANDHAPGLLCQAEDGRRQITFVVPTPHFTLSSLESIHPQLRPEFTAIWTGFLKVNRAGTYTLFGEGKLFIDGQEAQGGAVWLEAGNRPLRIEYDRSQGEARLQWQWESDFFSREPVPPSAFVHDPGGSDLGTAERLARGRLLVEEHHCIGCHQSEGELVDGRGAPDLTDAGSRLKAEWIHQWLEGPRRFRSDAIMPVTLTSVADRADVAAYLQSLRKEAPALKVPEGEELIELGRALFFRIGCAACHGDEELALAGLGSKMPPSHLARYLQAPLEIDPSGRMPDLLLSEEESAALAQWLVQSRNSAFEQTVPAGNPGRGRMLVREKGCANCHSIQDNGSPVEAVSIAPFLESLEGKGGCLSEKPPSAVPNYAFSAADREAISAWLNRPDVSPAPVQDFQRLVQQFRCSACHDVQGPARAVFMPSPPPLGDAGNKWRQEALEALLAEKERARPWMDVRMPHYGEHAARFVELLAKQSGAPLEDGIEFPAATVEQLHRGAQRLGRGHGGLSCISCHDFRGKPAHAEMRGPDLAGVFGRLRVDWLRRWLYEPARIVPGTPMPSFFTEVSTGEARQQIEQILQALSAGDAIPMPEGLQDAENYLIEPADEPVLFRGFLPGSSARSIAVGLPGGVAYCFDAASCQLRYAWTGDFLDARPVWHGRGGQQPRIRGRKFFVAQEGVPFRLGNVENEPSARFAGYRLVQGVPEFRYHLDGVEVFERLEWNANHSGLVRHFELQGLEEEAWFYSGGSAVRVEGQRLEPASGGWVKLPRKIRLKFQVEIPLQSAPSQQKGNRL